MLAKEKKIEVQTDDKRIINGCSMIYVTYYFVMNDLVNDFN